MKSSRSASGRRTPKRAPPPSSPSPEDAQPSTAAPQPSDLFGVSGNEKVPETLNPFELGRKAREATENLWSTFVDLGSGFSSRSSGDYDLDVDMSRVASPSDGEAMTCDVGTDKAETNTVLVVGATGSVGKIVVRKLVLRGYNVRCLVRPRDDIPLQPSTRVGPDVRVGGRHGRTLRFSKGETTGPPLEAVCGDAEAKQILGLPQQVSIVWGNLASGLDCYRAIDPCCACDADSESFRKYGWEALCYAPYDKPPTTKVVYCVRASNPDDEGDRSLCDIDGVGYLSQAYQTYWNGMTQMQQRNWKRDRRLQTSEFNKKGKTLLFMFSDNTTAQGRGFNAALRGRDTDKRVVRGAGGDPKQKRQTVTRKRYRGVESWRVTEPSTGKGGGASKPMSPQERLRREYIEALGVKNEATVRSSEYKGVMRFEGEVYAKGGVAEARAPFDAVDLPGVMALEKYEGLQLECSSDGQPCYWCILEDETGNRYRYRMSAMSTYQTWKKIRVPWSSFRPMNNKTPPLDVSKLKYMGIRYEAPSVAQAEKIKLQEVLRSRDFDDDVDVRLSIDDDDDDDDFDDEDEDKELLAAKFRIDCSKVSLLPRQEEPDFVLLSCTGAGAAKQMEEARGRALNQPNYKMSENESTFAERDMRRTKTAGEDRLKATGLAYTIVRPGPLQDVPSGLQALVFDQSGRVRNSIGTADVADVVVRSLHEEKAVNKSFEVCYEQKSDLPTGLDSYELVAHLSSLETDYLKPALEPLERNI